MDIIWERTIIGKWCGTPEYLVLPFSLTTLALDWRLQSDLASHPSVYSTVLRSARTIPGLFGTTFNSNWKITWFGLFIGWWEFPWHHSSPTWFTELLVFFFSEVDQTEIHFLLATDRETIHFSMWFSLGLFCNENVGKGVLEPVGFIIL